MGKRQRALLAVAVALCWLLPAHLALSATLVSPVDPTDPAYMPLRAAELARSCTTPDDGALRERLTSFCAGYVHAVLENDPRLDDCHPLRAEVMDEIAARQRSAPQTDDDVLARDFVVTIARNLCRRAGA